MNTENTGSEIERLQKRIRVFLWIFIVGLVLSGVTAFPLVAELNLLAGWFGESGDPARYTGIAHWIATVHSALNDADFRYPFLFYGTDWLAFGHLIIALFLLDRFVTPYAMFSCSRQVLPPVCSSSHLRLSADRCVVSRSTGNSSTARSVSSGRYRFCTACAIYAVSKYYKANRSNRDRATAQ